MKVKAKWKNILVGLVLVLILASTMRFEKLDEVRAKAAIGQFDAEAFARDFWEQDLMPGLHEAIELEDLMELLKNDPQVAFETHSKALGIGNIRFFFVEGQGTIRETGENDLSIALQQDLPDVKIATEYIFGNAVRDASGKVNIQDFENTMDFNNVSAAINAIIRNEVLPALKEQASIGDQIKFVGAIEMNREQVDLNALEIIPVKVDFINQDHAPGN